MDEMESLPIGSEKESDKVRELVQSWKTDKGGELEALAFKAFNLGFDYASRLALDFLSNRQSKAQDKIMDNSE